MTINKKLISGSVWAFSGKLLMTLSGFLINIFLARVLSPEEVGNYFLIISLITFTSTFALFGLPKAAVKLIAESFNEQGKIKHIITIVLLMATLGVFLSASALLFGLNDWLAIELFDAPILANLTGIIILWFILFTCQQMMAEIYRGYNDIKLATLFNGLLTSILSAILLIVFYNSYRVFALSEVINLIICAYLISVLFSSLLLWYKLLPVANERISMVKARETLTEISVIAWPLWITSLALLALTQVDVWLLGVFRTQEEVAIYSIAARLIIIISIPLIVVNAVIPPIISQLHAQKNTRKLQKILRLTATLSSIPAIIALGVFIFFGDFILTFIFGKFYQSSTEILVILSIGQTFNVCAGSCGLALMLTKHQITMMLITLFSGLITIITSWYLVYDYGAKGVATGTTCGIILQNLLMLLLTRYKLGIWTNLDPFIFFNRKAREQ